MGTGSVGTPAASSDEASMPIMRRGIGVRESREEETFEISVVAYEATKPAIAVRSFGSWARSAVKISPAAARSSGSEDSRSDLPAARNSATEGFDFRRQ